MIRYNTCTSSFYLRPVRKTVSYCLSGRLSFAPQKLRLLFTVFHRTKSSGDQKIHMHLVVAYWVITKWLKFSKSIGGNKFSENNFHFIGGAFRYLRIFSCFMETIPFWMLTKSLSSKECFGTIFLTISEMTIAVDQIWVIAEFLHFSQ